MTNLIKRIKDCEADKTKEEKTAIVKDRRISYCPLILNFFNQDTKCVYLQRESYPIEEKNNGWRVKIRHSCLKRYVEDFEKGEKR